LAPFVTGLEATLVNQDIDAGIFRELVAEGIEEVLGCRLLDGVGAVADEYSVPASHQMLVRSASEKGRSLSMRASIFQP
jgi:hypothetical protein